MGMVTSLVAVCTVAIVGDAELLFFTGARCLPCEQVKPAVVQLQQRGYRIVTLDIAEHPEVADRFAIDQVPAFVLVRDGQVLDRALGPISVQKMAAMLEFGDSQGIASPPVQSPQPASPLTPSAQRPTSPSATDFPAASARSTSVDLEDEHHGWTDHIGFVNRLDGPQRHALAATVRITVTEANSHAFGSGTIIDQKGEDALILTCGHLFRDAASNTSIEVEFGFPQQTHKVPAMVMGFDDQNHDIALVVARVGVPVTVAPLARPEMIVNIGDPLFSIGCDGGADPTVFETRIKAITQYFGAKKFDTFGRPAQGRSGGGLFTAGGQLIGVCNAAAVHVDEGIFAGSESLTAILQHHGLFDLLRHPSHLAQVDPRMRQAPSASSNGPPVAQDSPAAAFNPVGLRTASRELRIIEQVPGQPGATREIVILDPEPELIALLEARSQAGSSRHLAQSESAVPASPQGPNVALDEPWRNVSPGYGSQGELLRSQSPR